MRIFYGEREILISLIREVILKIIKCAQYIQIFYGEREILISLIRGDFLKIVKII